jgi:hypothetical protein
MAETLGSLADKLTIKDIREFHLRQMLERKDRKFSQKDLKAKLRLLNSQKQDLVKEIDEFVFSAYKFKLRLKDEKLKLYNALQEMGRIPQTRSLGAAISGLAEKNLQLWHLEDEARRKDVNLAYVGKVKNRIDIANQQRNDFIDRIDELFDQMVREHFRKKSK